MPGFPLLENGAERGPASRTARQRQDLLSGGPRHCLLETQHLRAPRSWTLLPGPTSSPGRGLCLLRPSVPSASARAPLAQLRRVTRGARLRRPPRAGAGGWDSRRAGGMAAAGTVAGPAGPEPMPSYAQLVQRGWGSALAAARGCADCGWGLARRGLAEHAHLAPPELLLLALGALGWTALRSAATARLFRVSAAGGRDMGAPGWGTPGRPAPLSVSAGLVTECGGPRAGGARDAGSWAVARPLQSVRRGDGGGCGGVAGSEETRDVGTPIRVGCSCLG